MNKADENQTEELAPLTEEEIAKRKALIKKHFASYGILTGILAAMIVILLTFTLISRKSWRNGLREEVSQVLEKTDSSYTVGEWVKLNTPFTTTASVYKITESGNSSKWLYGIIIRITTMYGPLGAVYVYDLKADTTKFIGFADTASDIAAQIEHNSRFSQIKYWSERIPLILKGSLGDNEEVRE